jgi:glycosyltransferase involved in cell wall biosynthesis
MKKTPKVSIVIPVYKPEKEVFDRLRKALREQTIKAEIIESWNMPEAKSMNTGIKKAKGDIVITLAQDCIPENKFWLEKLIKPLEDKNIVCTISDLHLPEEYWKKYPFWIRIFTIADRKDKKNGMDARACAYRKKDIINIGLFDEDPKVIGIDLGLSRKLETKGKIVRANVKVLHLHKLRSFNEVIKKMYTYSEANGKVIKAYGFNIGTGGFWIRIIKALPFFGMILSFARFPYKRYFYLFPIYLFFAIPVIHIINLTGFWRGFFLDKESVRNLEVLRK